MYIVREGLFDVVLRRADGAAAVPAWLSRASCKGAPIVGGINPASPISTIIREFLGLAFEVMHDYLYCGLQPYIEALPPVARFISRMTSPLTTIVIAAKPHEAPHSMSSYLFHRLHIV